MIFEQYNQDEGSLEFRLPMIRQISRLRKLHLDLPKPETREDQMFWEPIMINGGHLSYA